MKVKKILFIFSLFICSVSFCYGQTWLWGRMQSNSPNSGGGEGLMGAIDACNNYYLTIQFDGTLVFGNTTLYSNSNYGTLGIIKYDPNGKVLWANQATSNSNSSFNQADAITTDRFGNYFFAESGFGNIIYQGKNLTSSSGCAIVKCDYIGNVVWISKPVSQYCYVWNMITDNKGSLFVIGESDSTIIFGNDTLAYGGYFMAKYAPDGNVIWARSISPPYASVAAIALDKFGNIYATGGYGNPYSYWIVEKFDSLGNPIWWKYSVNTNTASSYGENIIVDKGSNVYVQGGFDGTFSMGGDTISSAYRNVFVAKFDTTGNIKWLKCAKIIDSSFLVPAGFAEDNQYNLYMCGSVAQGTRIGKKVGMIIGSDTVIAKDYFDPAFIEKLDSSGNGICGSIVNSGGDDLSSMGVDSTGNYVYFGGDLIVTTIFGRDTLIAGTAGEVPFVARWEKCQNDVVLTLNGCNIYECLGWCNDSVTVYPVGGRPPYTYLWTTTPEQSNQTAKGLCIGGYGIKVKDANGDSSSLNIVINKDTIHHPAIRSCCDSSVVRGQSVSLYVSGGIKYFWSPNIAISCDTCPNPIVNPTTTTKYTVTIINDSGCAASAFITIDVHCGDMFIPDVFSPNEAHNSILYVRGPCIAQLDFMVFDRWGNKLFESENPDIGWDGTYKGQGMNVGTYVYYAKATMYDGSFIEKKGNVTLVR